MLQAAKCAISCFVFAYLCLTQRKHEPSSDSSADSDDNKAAPASPDKTPAKTPKKKKSSKSDNDAAESGVEKVKKKKKKSKKDADADDDTAATTDADVTMDTSQVDTVSVLLRLSALCCSRSVIDMQNTLLLSFRFVHSKQTNNRVFES